MSDNRGMPLAIGETINGCTVLQRLGAGATACVHLVRHEASGVLYALKVLEHTSEDIRRRLVDEGKAQRQLKHPNIVDVFDIMEVDGQPALLMEYVDGPSLESVLEQGPMSIASADGVAVSLLAAMSHAHSLGIIHRDLKPGNVLLQRLGTLWYPKIVDFGVAKILGRDQNQGRVRTQTGSALGTPAYMAPEQIRDAKNIDVRADIYSLGAIFYEMLTGQPVFPGEDLLTIFAAVVQGEYIPIREAAPHVPERMAMVVDRCLLIEPADRFPSCRETLSAWQSCKGILRATPLPVSPVTVGPPTTVAKPRPFSLGPLPRIREVHTLLRPIAALSLVAVVGMLVPGMQDAIGLPSVDIPDTEMLATDADATGQLMDWLRHGDDGQSALAWEILLARWDAGTDDLEQDMLAFAGEGSRPRNQRALEAITTRADPWLLVDFLEHADPDMRVTALDALVGAVADTDRETELEPILAERRRNEKNLRVQHRLTEELKRLRGKHGRDYQGIPVRTRLD